MLNAFQRMNEPKFCSHNELIQTVGASTMNSVATRHKRPAQARKIGNRTNAKVILQEGISNVHQTETLKAEFSAIVNIIKEQA